jgi:hypothetical protein
MDVDERDDASIRVAAGYEGKDGKQQNVGQSGTVEYEHRMRAPVEILRLRSARCASIASVFTSGITTAAPMPRSGQIAPKMYAEV